MSHVDPAPITNRLDTVARHCRILEAQLETYERGTTERWGVVRYNLYLMFAKVVEAADKDIPGFLPEFSEEEFLEENGPQGKRYNVAAIRGYLKSALAALEGDMALARSAERRYMEMAIDRASRSVREEDRPRPHVGVVVVKARDVLATAFRGERKAGEHAEYTALEGILENASIAGATVYTTLEPCTTRNHPKVPCAERLIERKVGRVVIGMLDPDPRITGQGVRLLRDANIEVELFPGALASRVEEMNREFTRGVREAKFSTSVRAAAGPSIRVEYPKRNSIGGISMGGGFFPEWNLPIRLVAPAAPTTIVDLSLTEEGVGVWERVEIVDVRGRPIDLPVSVANAVDLWLRSKSPKTFSTRPGPQAFGSFELHIRDHTLPEADSWIFRVPDEMKGDP